MSDNKATVNSGPSLCTLLTVLFVALKLLHKINWSWWWVLAPTWIPFAVVFSVLIPGGLIALLLARRDSKRDRALREYQRSIR
jgi:predicted tellurium resistance membrane protein TerC